MPRFGGVTKLLVGIGGLPPQPPVKSKNRKRKFTTAAAPATTKSDASKASSQLFVSAPATSSKVGTSSQMPISTAKTYSAAADKKHKQTNKRPAESGITKTEDYKKKLRSSSGGTKE